MEAAQVPEPNHLPFAYFHLQLVARNGVVPEWFHSVSSRSAAERLLMSKPAGYFLIRASESRMGYTLSYRAEDRCKHFMIDVLTNGRFAIVGENINYESLQNMVDFHRKTPILPGGEILTFACVQNEAETPSPPKSPNASLHQWSGPVPPVLPARPQDTALTAAASPPPVLTETFDSNRLYPVLDNHFGSVISTVPMQPVPKPRKSITLPTTRPELPGRSIPPPSPSPSLAPATSSEPRTPSPSPTSRQSPPGQPLQTPQKPSSQEPKTSMVKNLKSMFHKGRSSRSLEPTYAEIEEIKDRGSDVETCGVQRTTENAVGMSAESALPVEYQMPPPFAPGH